MHDQINSNFSSGQSVNATIEDIISGRLSVHALPTIRVAKRKGRYYAFDNRRLYVYRVLEHRGHLTQITVKEAPSSQFKKSRYSSKNKGVSVEIRRGSTLTHTHSTSTADSEDM